jgi:hypothetical protein
VAGAGAGAGAGATEGITTLPRAALDFHRHPVTWRRLVPAVVTVGARLSRRRFDRWDAVAALGVVAAYVPAEWLGHHVGLHGLSVGPVAPPADTAAVRSHLAHHREPDDLELLFVRLDKVPTTVALATAATIGLSRWRAAPLTGYATALTLTACHYWIHFLMHSDYELRSRWLRTVEANHMRHHHLDEHRWRMGVLSMTGDRVVGRVRSRMHRTDRTPRRPTPSLA